MRAGRLAMLVRDFVVDRLVAAGVRHVFGVGGANIEDLFSAVQGRRPAIRAVLGKHEHAAGCAADAYARITGLGVVMTTSGGGAMNLVHAMGEARASRSPVLAIVGEPPTDLQGRGAFQDTSGKDGAIDARAIFEAAAGRCVRARSPDEVPLLLAQALDAVLAERRPAVLLLAKDLQRAALNDASPSAFRRPRAKEPVAQEDLARALDWLGARRIVIVAGDAVARSSSCDALATLAARLDAKVATTPDGRDAFDNRDPRFVGVAGAMGHGEVGHAIAEAELVVAIGTRLPLLARQGLEPLFAQRRLLSIGDEAPFVAGRESLHLEGDLSLVLRAIDAALGDGEARAAAGSITEDANDDAENLSVAGALRVVDRAIPAGSVVLVDAGNTGASAIHHLRAPRGGRWFVAMGMAGMGWAFGASIGAALATGERCFVIAGDGAFFMHGLEVHTAVEHALPITYVVFNNRAHGMCLVRERLLLHENAGYNAFRASHLGAAFAAAFPGLFAADCTRTRELASFLERSTAIEGPAFASVELDDVEVPPFVAFREIAPGATTVAREVAHD